MLLAIPSSSTSRKPLFFSYQKVLFKSVILGTFRGGGHISTSGQTCGMLPATDNSRIMRMECTMWEPDSAPAMFCLDTEIAAAARAS